jgi:hypothetical protein
MNKIIKEAVVEAQPKKWQFRELKGKDIFLMLPVLKKLGINNLKKCFSGDLIKGIVAENKGAGRDKQIEAATMGAMLEFGQVLIEGLDGCENEIYNLLEKTSNLTRAEIEDLGLVELPEMIIDFVKKEEFKDFLKVAQSYIK